MCSHLAYEGQAESAVVVDCLAQMLRPLIKIFLRFRIGMPTFAAVARRLFVELAQEQIISDQGARRKISHSSIAALTGIPAKVVSVERNHKFAEADHKLIPISPEAAVLGLWSRDPTYHTESGSPRELKVYGPGLSFENLVKRCLRKTSYVSVLDRLIGSESVEYVQETDRLKLISPVYKPPATAAVDLLEIAARSSRRFASTLLFNIAQQVKDSDRRFRQHELYTRQLPPERLHEFRSAMRNLLLQQEEAAFHAIEPWEAPVRQDNHMIAGVGYYFFEESPETIRAYQQFDL